VKHLKYVSLKYTALLAKIGLCRKCLPETNDLAFWGYLLFTKENVLQHWPQVNEDAEESFNLELMNDEESRQK
jgi:hypothetical protein